MNKTGRFVKVINFCLHLQNFEICLALLDCMSRAIVVARASVVRTSPLKRALSEPSSGLRPILWKGDNSPISRFFLFDFNIYFFILTIFWLILGHVRMKISQLYSSHSSYASAVEFL